MATPDDESIGVVDWAMLFLAYALLKAGSWFYFDWVWQTTERLLFSVLKDSTVWGIVRNLLNHAGL